MPADVVIDASVVAKIYFDEEDSDLAEAALADCGALIAPDLLFVEMASIAAKRARRGFSMLADGLRMLQTAPALIHDVAPIAPLCDRALELAALHGFSAYDGVYLALAERRRLRVLTADAKLARRAREVGLGDFVFLLGG